MPRRRVDHRAVVAAVLAFMVLTHLSRPDEPWLSLGYLLVLGTASAAAVLGAARAPRGDRQVPALIAAGITSSTVGDLVWYGYLWAGNQSDVSLADVPWFLGYVFLLAALGTVLVRAQGNREDVVEAVIDALTIVTLSVTLLWSVSVSAIVSDDTYTASERAVLSAYPIADAVLLALVLRCLADPRARRAISGWFALGAAAWLVADLLYLLLTLTPVMEVVTDAGWMLGAALMATGAWGQHHLDPEDAARLERSGLGRLAIATVPLLVPPTLELVTAIRGGEPHPVQTAVGMGVLLALAFLRTLRLLRAEAHAREALATARDAALEASRAKSAFLATMSHEIRTPMNGVIGLTGLLLTTELDERQRQYADGVRGAGEALLAVINDILDFSKVEAGKLELETIDFNLLQVVEEAAELVTTAAQRKDLELLAYCTPDLPLGLRGDPSRLRQVLLNLVSNAVKFTEHGEVVIRAQLDDLTDEGVSVRFEVTDTGIGLDPDDADRLFEPFSQADSSTTRRFGGTGLGLAICHQLVTMLGGRIGVTSEPGQGSTFWFTLPFLLAEAQPPPPPCPAGLAGLHALVVDDNRTNRLIVTDQLGAWGVTCDEVADAASALDRLRAEAAAGTPYALVLTDLCMPGMDGLDLGRAVTADPQLAGTRIVLLTSGPDVDPAEAAAAGIDVRLTKPVRLSQLHAALQRVAAPTESPSSDQAPPRPRDRGHVLVVEDSTTNQMVALGMLEHLGYTADVAHHGREALDALARRDYDAILMDCQMPEMDGFAATQELRLREGTTRRTPVIALTAGISEEEQQRCRDAGMDDYLSKPIDPRTLGETLARWMPHGSADVVLGDQA